MPPSARCSTYAKPETTGPFTAPADALRSKVHSDASVVRQSVFSGRGSPEGWPAHPHPTGFLLGWRPHRVGGWAPLLERYGLCDSAQQTTKLRPPLIVVG